MLEKSGETYKDYTLIDRIDDGMSAHVWLAMHNPSNTKVAIKIVEKMDITSSQLVLKLICGITMMKHIKHPFVTRFYEAIETPTQFILVLEYCERGTLESFVRENTVLTEENACKIFSQIAVSLDFLHNNVHIAHRDIKPTNVLLDKKNNVHLADFGLSKYFSEAYPLFSTPCGTPQYIAPEMLNGKQYTAKADIWSLGVLLYFMVTGHVPFEGKSITELTQKISYSDPIYPPFLSIDVIDLLQKLMNKNPDERPTIADVINHRWVNHTNLIQNIKQNIKSFFEVERETPKFKSVSEKILFVEKEKDEFSLEAHEQEKSVSFRAPIQVYPIKIIKNSRSDSFHRKRVRTSCSGVPLDFPRRKSSI